MVQAVAAFRNQALFWNLSAAVGPGQPNKADDVEFVRLSYFLAKDNPKFTSGDFAVMKPILQKVTTTGAFDSALAEAIRTHERLRGGAQDGKVSVAKANDFGWCPDTRRPERGRTCLRCQQQAVDWRLFPPSRAAGHRNPGRSVPAWLRRNCRTSREAVLPNRRTTENARGAPC